MWKSASAGVGVRRNEVPGAIVASASTCVASGSIAFGKASTRVASSCGGAGILPAELSPANGVPTPRCGRFLAADFWSGGDLESSMLRFRNGPRLTKQESQSNEPDRALVGTSWWRKYIPKPCPIQNRFMKAALVTLIPRPDKGRPACGGIHRHNSWRRGSTGWGRYSRPLRDRTA